MNHKKESITILAQGSIVLKNQHIANGMKL